MGYLLLFVSVVGFLVFGFAAVLSLILGNMQTDIDIDSDEE